MDNNSRITISNLIENNTTKFFLELGHLNNDEITDNNEIKYVLTKNWHSRIFMANFNESNASENVKKIVSEIKKMHISVLWYLTPMSRPKNLQNFLMDYGFKYQNQWRSMAINLKKLPNKYIIPEDITIKEVLNLDELKTWTEVLVKSFEFPKVALSYKKYFCNLGVENINFHYYLAFLNEDPVATAMLYKGEEVSGLFYVGTVHEARRKGIAKSLTYYLLNKAKINGYNICTVQASDMGYQLYKKIGFKEYYVTRIYSFKPF